MCVCVCIYIYMIHIYMYINLVGATDSMRMRICGSGSDLVVVVI